jgi:hypothetical protein
LWIGNSCGFGDFGERAVTIVVIKGIGKTFQTARTALNVNAMILADLAGTECGKAIEADVNAVGNKQVSPTVTVVITESRTHGPTVVGRQACLFGDVGKGAIAVVAIKRYSVEASDQ